VKANEVLLWLSARREGSWQQFRAAVEELCSDGETGEAESRDAEFPLHQQLRLNLERLGHVEFFAAGCEEGWRVAPPRLATCPFADGVRGVLCGARSPALRERFLQAAGSVALETQTVPRVPDVLRVVASDTRTLEGVAEQAGVLLQLDAPFAILSHLPPCTPPSRKQSTAEFPQGADWSIHEFDASELAWRKTDRARTQTAHVGVFRFVLYQRPRYFLRWQELTYEIPRGVALFALLKRRRREVLHYDAPTRSLTLPAICRPPRLLERALVLCSGLPPVFDPATARLTYVDISLEIARLTAELLRQPLK
jgi:hypothetical protein